MKYSVAVGTYRAEVHYRVHLVLYADLRERAKMMDMDKSFDHAAVCPAEVEAANRTTGAMMLDAVLASRRIPFVGVDSDPDNRALMVGHSRLYLVRASRPWRIALVPGARASRCFTNSSLIC